MMRMKWQRRARKILRRMRGRETDLAKAVARLERQGRPFPGALRAVLLEPGQKHRHRATVAKLLSLGGDDSGVRYLLAQFFEQSDKDELYATGLALEQLNDRRAVPPFIDALLGDGNPHRRQAAARALGWIQNPGRPAARALAQSLMDMDQPQAVREEAAESLAYVGNAETLGPLISALRDADVRIRFWAVFGLGRSCRGDAGAIRELKSMLDDGAVPPGNWWSVGREAMAMLGTMERAGTEHRLKFEAEWRGILGDLEANEEDRRWALHYGNG